MWRPSRPVGLDSGAEIAQRSRQLSVPAERQDDGNVVLQRRTAGGDDRQSAGEADSHHADTAIRREVALPESHSAASSIASVVCGEIV